MNTVLTMIETDVDSTNEGNETVEWSTNDIFMRDIINEPSIDPYGWIEGETCCKCIGIRSGMIILSIILILDSGEELLFGEILFSGIWTDIALSYAIFLFFGGILGLYGAYKLHLTAIIIYFYWCCINVMIQIGLCIYIIFAFTQKENLFWSVIFILDTLFGIAIWYYLLGVIKRFEKLIYHHHHINIIQITMK